jgi:hypothetical protein
MAASETHGLKFIARVEVLKKMRALHAREGRAIEDALNALRFLEREEERYGENQRRQALETANTETAIDRTEDQDIGRFCFGIVDSNSFSP